MLLKFDHREKMIGKSIAADESLSENNSIPVSLKDSEMEEIHFEDGDSILALVVTSTKSLLLTPSPMSVGGGYTWQISKDKVKYLDSGDDSLTVWMTNTDKLDDISIDGLAMDTDLITGDKEDPTGGTDLFIRTRDLTPRNEDKTTFDGMFRIPATPIRNWVNINSDSLEFKFCRTDKSSQPKTSDERKILQDGVKAVVPKQVREELNLSPENHEVAIWTTTSSICSSNESQEEDEVGDESEETTNEEGDGQESAIESQSEGGSDNEETHLSEVSTNGESLVEAATERSAEESDQNAAESDTTASETDVETQATTESTTTTDTAATSEVGASLLGEKEIVPEVNSDLTPVVLLDEDERTQENWTGHYQTEDGDLLCDREYTRAIPDPERDHYGEVCQDCLKERPGALSEEDITAIFEHITGSKFTDELPIILDRKKAAEVISVIAANVYD